MTESMKEKEKEGEMKMKRMNQMIYQKRKEYQNEAFINIKLLNLLTSRLMRVL